MEKLATVLTSASAQPLIGQLVDIATQMNLLCWRPVSSPAPVAEKRAADAACWATRWVRMRRRSRALSFGAADREATPTRTRCPLCLCLWRRCQRQQQLPLRRPSLRLRCSDVLLPQPPHTPLADRRHERSPRRCFVQLREASRPARWRQATRSTIASSSATRSRSRRSSLRNTRSRSLRAQGASRASSMWTYEPCRLALLWTHRTLHSKLLSVSLCLLLSTASSSIEPIQYSIIPGLHTSRRWRSAFLH